MSLNLGQHHISVEIFTTVSGEEISIPKYHFVFNKWTKPDLLDNYNGKTILAHNNEPLFAELIILRLLEDNGFKGVWVDTYRNKFWNKLPCLSKPILPDNKLKEVYDNIYQIKGGRKAGCFDVIAYNEKEFVFIELKRKQKDKIRHSQIEWLEAGLNLGYDNERFIIAEWEIKE